MTVAVVRHREFNRVDRVASTVKRVLAPPINELARARGAGLATITEVDISPDLRHGVVYVSVYGDAAQRQAFVDELTSSASRLQAVLGRSLRTRRTPKLSFRLDSAIERGDRVSRLLSSSRLDAEP